MSSTDVNITSSTSMTSTRARLEQIAALLDQPQVMRIALVIILIAAAWLRFHGLNWDEGHHLHPNERFLSTVTNNLQWPQNLDSYFDPDVSTLSPYSLPDMGLYVYGTLPVYVVKWTAILLERNNYDEITLIGRTMSGLFDIETILFLFLIGSRLYNAKVGLLAAGLLSLSVSNVQLPHFFTVNIFATLLVVAALYFMLPAN